MTASPILLLETVFFYFVPKSENLVMSLRVLLDSKLVGDLKIMVLPQTFIV